MLHHQENSPITRRELRERLIELQAVLELNTPDDPFANCFDLVKAIASCNEGVRVQRPNGHWDRRDSFGQLPFNYIDTLEYEAYDNNGEEYVGHDWEIQVFSPTGNLLGTEATLSGCSYQEMYGYPQGIFGTLRAACARWLAVLNDKHSEFEFENPAAPIEILTSWPEIFSALNRKDSVRERRRIQRLNQSSKHPGPIRSGGRGTQPTVKKNDLLAWWNSLAEAHAESTGREADQSATVSESYRHGRTGEVVPEISGHVVKSRNMK